jgi:hypothetical protein
LIQTVRDVTPAPFDYAQGKPPRWLLVATITITILLLVMAVAETTLWIHFVVDRGEAISLAGLAFIFGAGLYLHRTKQLRRSLPLVLPWVLYPVVTQGDQLIDNLNINQMRVITHVILALLFGAPVAVLVLAAGLRREQGAMLAIALLVLEMVIAYWYLGVLMIITLTVMVVGVGEYLRKVVANPGFRLVRVTGAAADRLALYTFVAACLISLGLYAGYKNRPGAYQGSPHYFHDPSQRNATYPMDAIAVPANAASPVQADVLARARDVLSEYGGVLEELLAAYYVMDRNYNYWFHNELFIRDTPITEGFRESSLKRIHAARDRAAAADATLADVRARLPPHHPLAAFVDEVAAYTHFNLRRAAMLEEMSAGFERTKAGLQHATHLYEGEGKAAGAVLAGVLAKHRRTLDDRTVSDATRPFVERADRIQQAYANRIVGF